MPHTWDEGGFKDLRGGSQERKPGQERFKDRPSRGSSSLCNHQVMHPVFQAMHCRNIISQCNFFRKSYTLPGGVSSPADGSPRELQEFQTFGEASHQIGATPEMCGAGNPEPEYLTLKQFPASSERPRPSSLFVSKRAFLRGVFQPSPTVPGSLPTTPSDLRTGPPGNSRSRSENQ